MSLFWAARLSFSRAELYLEVTPMMQHAHMSVNVPIYG